MLSADTKGLPLELMVGSKEVFGPDLLSNEYST